MAKPARLDTELVRRGLVASRAEARRAIERGSVAVRGVPTTRSAALVPPDAPITLVGPAARFVSRGGEKLEVALGRLGVEVAGRRWLDAGASTGGFTDCLLQRGAAFVVAADVGYGQLHWRLRNDERVVVMERVNVRHLRREQLPWAPEGVVADLSFISLRMVMPALVSSAVPEADFVVLVKPQFEAGRGAVGRSGVVRDAAEWVKAMTTVAGAAAAEGLGVAGAVPSALPGPAGNHEFFLHLKRGVRGNEDLLSRAVDEVP